VAAGVAQSNMALLCRCQTLSERVDKWVMGNRSFGGHSG
jgi:hypothetical protein